MTEVLIKFNLPEGMDEADLVVMLRDSLSNFVQVRCDGDAEAYAAEKFAEQHKDYMDNTGKPWSVQEQHTVMSRILHYTRSRIEWARSLFSDGIHVMREVAVPQDEEDRKHNEAVRLLKEW